MLHLQPLAALARPRSQATRLFLLRDAKVAARRLPLFLYPALLAARHTLLGFLPIILTAQALTARLLIALRQQKLLLVSRHIHHRERTLGLLLQASLACLLSQLAEEVAETITLLGGLAAAVVVLAI